MGNEVLRAVQSGSHNATSTTWVQALEVSGSESIASFASSQFQSNFSKTRLERDTSSATLEMYADDGFCVERFVGGEAESADALDPALSCSCGNTRTVTVRAVSDGCQS